MPDDLLEPENGQSHEALEKKELILAKEALAQEHHEEARQKEELEKERLALEAQKEREAAQARADAYRDAVLLPSEILAETMAKVRLTIFFVGIFYTGLVILLVVSAIVLLAPNVIQLIDHNSPIVMNTGRILISLIAIACGAVALLIGLSHRKVNESMALAEGQIDIIRDRALIQMQATRYNLDDLTERLRMPTVSNQQAAGPLEYIELIKKAGPLLNILLAKERSLVTLGMEGLKFYQSLKKVLGR